MSASSIPDRKGSFDITGGLKKYEHRGSRGSINTAPIFNTSIVAGADRISIGGTSDNNTSPNVNIKQLHKGFTLQYPIVSPHDIQQSSSF